MRFQHLPLYIYFYVILKATIGLENDIVFPLNMLHASFSPLYLSAESAYIHVCRRLFSTTIALSFDGWSFSLACSCLMNPTVHVLIECFLYGLKFAPQPPPASHCRRAPPPPPLVCEAAHWWLMNKGSLVAHFPYESSGLCKQTAVQKPHTWQHTAHHTRRGKWKQRHFPH